MSDENRPRSPDRPRDGEVNATREEASASADDTRRELVGLLTADLNHFLVSNIVTRMNRSSRRTFLRGVREGRPIRLGRELQELVTDVTTRLIAESSVNSRLQHGRRGRAAAGTAEGSGGGGAGEGRLSREVALWEMLFSATRTGGSNREDDGEEEDSSGTEDREHEEVPDGNGDAGEGEDRVVSQADDAAENSAGGEAAAEQPQSSAEGNRGGVVRSAEEEVATAGDTPTSEVRTHDNGARQGV